MATFGGLRQYSKFLAEQLANRPGVHRLFHWKNSSGLIFFLWGTPIAMVSVGATLEAIYLFTWAYFLAICAFLWTLGAWLTSDYLRKKEKPPTRRQRRGLDKCSRKSFLLWKWAVVGFIGIVFTGVLKSISGLKSSTELRLFKGILIPAGDPTPPNNCGVIPKGGVILFYGDDAAIVIQFPHTVLYSGSLGPLIVLFRSMDTVWVAEDIRDPEGKIIAHLGGDGFVVNPNNIMSMNRPDRSTLRVTDQYGIKVLDIRYLNPEALRIDGSFYYPGQKESTPLQLRSAHHICTMAQGVDVLIR
jgi:hypothetical protein